MSNEGDQVRQDAENMRAFGFIYADGSYSDERLPKGAMLVPRRPSPQHKWDQGKRAWVIPAAAVAPAPAPTPPQPEVAALEAAAAPLAPAASAAPVEVPAVQPDAGLDPALAGMLASTVTPTS